MTVTAERVKTIESKTPVAITVLSGTQLRNAGVTDPSTLPQYIPDFSIDPGNANRITIRGVTSYDTSDKGDPSTAFMLDGVYIARSDDIDVTFYDLARIEVLSGPQGTLYGRNTTAGVVDVISNPPADEYQAAINTTVGNFGTFLTDGMINIPVADGFALRASAAYDRRDNYLIPDPGDPIRLGLARNNFSGRLQGLITFSDKVSLLLKADYRYWNPQSTQTSVLQTNFFNMTDPTMPIYVDRSSRSERTLTFDQAIASSNNNNTWGVSAELNWDVGPLVLTYLGSHRETTFNEAFNFFFFNSIGSYEKDDHKQNSQELRFATSDSGPFRAQFGLYYFDEQAAQDGSVPGLGIPALPYFGSLLLPTTESSYAGFGQATYDLTPALHLTAGLRYTHDNKSLIGGDTYQVGRNYNPATDVIFLDDDSKTSSSKITWRGGLDYDLNDHDMLYATVATGYKSGGFNYGCLPGTIDNGQPCNNPTAANVLFYRPETLTSYEIGSKLRLADDTLQLNTDVFYYDYKNLQLQSIVLNNGVPASVITNAAGVVVKGAELAGTYLPDERNRLETTLTYLDGYYTDYFPLGVGVPPSYAGKPLDNSPHFTAAFGYTYTLPIVDFGSLALNAYSRWSASYVVSSFTVPVQFRQPSYTKTNLTLTYQPEAGAWYFQAFVKNLEDKIQITSAALDSVNITEPRTFGVRAGITF